MIFKKKTITLIIYLAALVAFAPCSTDMYLASMPSLQTYFKTSMSNVQSTLSMFFIVFAIVQLFWGPLADRIGRKPIIFIGTSIFILGSLLCANSDSIHSLIIARMIQAAGACSGIVMAIAIVKDVFVEPKKIAPVLSGIMSAMMLAPMIAPIIGSYLLVHINWQSIFYFLAFYGLLIFFLTFFIKESYPKALRKPLPLKKLFNAYKEQLQCTPFFLASVAASTNFSVMFSFIASSSFIYIKIYHLPTHLFGYFFAGNVLALVLGNLLLISLERIMGNFVLIMIAISISTIGAISMLTSIYLAPQSIWGVAIPSFIATYGVGVLYPETMSCALKHVVHYNGLASSLVGTIRFIFAALAALLMGIVITSSALPLGIVMLFLNISTAASMLGYFTIDKSHRLKK
jgi:DHA1 family bicyclomycin/chloramphenicol resistance-like MFS transporter